MKKVVIALIALIISVAIWGALATSQTPPTSTFKTESMSIGEISNTVSATGTLAAVDDVVVGAQLSGQITEVYVDFNDSVSENQLLAQLDPRTFAAQVAQAQANVDKTTADIALQQLTVRQAIVDLEQAQRDLVRAQELAKQRSISADELDDAETLVTTQQINVERSNTQLQVLAATLASNQASLAQAQIQLDRTEIRAPITGFVIDRTIEPGQTVASSYNTPELFTLAKDLTQMEIEAYIDESDIGQISLGQRAQFNVDAYPERQFRGKVDQIQKAPQTSSGVISYTVVINANNQQNLLLPGMTANLEISIDAVPKAQRISNAAIRVASRFNNNDEQPKQRGMLGQLNLTEAQRQLLRDKMPKRDASMGPGRGVAEQQKQRMDKILNEILTPEQLALRDQLQSGKIKRGQVLILRDGEAEPLQVDIGLSDDQYTQIISPDLTGLEVITQIKVQR
ncbi:efflux RND transporter periplasmic adaptor subunit [Ferrimonas lipolytica]|uniref:Efflux RND transporter periplasmic adaptor subunit n=1 Tax=Ferrimonas lipolytica TaxID=2724191 RepID=A0A6H1UJ31_9GAMM|nr:efflux RND transporter periplasmic adaptor subunit [Ferrimonas lipolytica]QIZ78620.1 efflux RND transporter periplasmic adaptor subunit [Ferrimonas lipolytica]